MAVVGCSSCRLVSVEHSPARSLLQLQLQLSCSQCLYQKLVRNPQSVLGLLTRTRAIQDCVPRGGMLIVRMCGLVDTYMSMSNLGSAKRQLRQCQKATEAVPKGNLGSAKRQLKQHRQCSKAVPKSGVPIVRLWYAVNTCLS